MTGAIGLAPQPSPTGGRSDEPQQLASDHRQRAALPRHLHAAAAALFDHLPPPPERAVVDGARGRLEQGRTRLAADLGPETELTVDAYRVRLAAGCPASAVPGDDAFSWTPATAARHLGLRALALHLRGDAPLPVERAVEEVVADHVRHGGDRTPGPWLAELGPAGRAVARASAQRWAEQAVAWLPLRLVGPRSLRLLDDDWWPGGARGSRTLVVHGRRDLTVDVGGRRVAVTLAGGTARDPGATDVDALTALAATLCDPRGRLVRLVRVHPASGEVVVADVTAALVARGAAVALSTASVLAAAATHAPVATAPGPGCTWCDRREGCPPGAGWLRRPDHRSMGLPLPSPETGAGSPPSGARRV